MIFPTWRCQSEVLQLLTTVWPCRKKHSSHLYAPSAAGLEQLLADGRRMAANALTYWSEGSQSARGADDDPVQAQGIYKLAEAFLTHTEKGSNYQLSVVRAAEAEANE